MGKLHHLDPVTEVLEYQDMLRLFSFRSNPHHVRCLLNSNHHVRVFSHAIFAGARARRWGYEQRALAPSPSPCSLTSQQHLAAPPTHNQHSILSHRHAHGRRPDLVHNRHVANAAQEKITHQHRRPATITLDPPHAPSITHPPTPSASKCGLIAERSTFSGMGL